MLLQKRHVQKQQNRHFQRHHRLQIAKFSPILCVEVGQLKILFFIAQFRFFRFVSFCFGFYRNTETRVVRIETSFEGSWSPAQHLHLLWHFPAWISNFLSELYQINKSSEKNSFFKIFFWGDFFLFFSYNIQHCFICRPSDSTVPTDAGIEPRTVATGALAVRRSNH